MSKIKSIKKDKKEMTRSICIGDVTGFVNIDKKATKPMDNTNKINSISIGNVSGVVNIGGGNINISK